MKRRSPRRAWLAVALAAASVTASCSEEGDPVPSAAADDPGVAHVHGLGMGPGDDVLYAATHFGLFAIPERGEATRIADRYQDTMAFTVDGPERFLASGHPDAQDEVLRKEGRPPHLGLIESRDEGDSWKSISLLGEADFHALSVAGETIYGYDSTGDRLMVSGDGGRTWDTRSTGIGMRDVAVSPEGGDTVVGAMPAGLERSVDGGRTFEPVPGAPPAALVSWPSPTRLWAVEASGALHQADAPEGPWTATGQVPGEPQAFFDTDDLLAAAVTGPDGRTAIYVSRDGATTWSLRYREPARS